jgi:hypothetical protein
MGDHLSRFVKPITIQVEDHVMTTVPGKNAVAALARTRPLLEQRRDALSRAIGRYVAGRPRYDQAEPARAGREAAGEMLLGWLLDQASGSGSVRSLRGIGARDCMRFGDGLAAVLKDELGAEASPALLSAWGDAYWAWMRAARLPALALAA